MLVCVEVRTLSGKSVLFHMLTIPNGHMDDKTDCYCCKTDTGNKAKNILYFLDTSKQTHLPEQLCTLFLFLNELHEVVTAYAFKQSSKSYNI